MTCLGQLLRKGLFTVQFAEYSKAALKNSPIVSSFTFDILKNIFELL